MSATFVQKILKLNALSTMMKKQSMKYVVHITVGGHGKDKKNLAKRHTTKIIRLRNQGLLHQKSLRELRIFFVVGNKFLQGD
jgi:hypothetical protein